jgi:tetratricopeptide (TPR) repeat protein
LSGSALYVAQGRAAEAEPLYREALNMARGTLGVSHPQTARILVNMGIMYASQGRYGVAVPLLEEALVIREEHLPPDHLLMAETLEHTATALRGVGQVAKADSFDRRAREIRGEPLENNT